MNESLRIYVKSLIGDFEQLSEKRASQLYKDCREVIDGRIKTASMNSRLLGVDDKVNKFIKAYNNIKLVKKSNYALSIKGTDYMPLSSKDNVSESDIFFSKNYQKIPPEMRTKTASSIVKAAKEHGIETDGLSLQVKAYGGIKIEKPHLIKAARDIALRATAVKHNNEDYIEIAKFISSNDLTQDNLVKVAELLERLDKSQNLEKDTFITSKYREELKVEDPITEIFGKEASDNTEEELPKMRILDSTYSPDDIIKLGTEQVKEALGESIYKELLKDGKLDKQKLLNIIPTLPKPEKQMLKRYLDAAV
jgi:hypothetical protein